MLKFKRMIDCDETDLLFAEILEKPVEDLEYTENETYEGDYDKDASEFIKEYKVVGKVENTGFYSCPLILKDQYDNKVIMINEFGYHRIIR